MKMGPVRWPPGLEASATVDALRAICELDLSKLDEFSPGITRRVRSVARRRGVRKRRLAPCPQYLSTALAVFSQSEQAATSQPRQPLARAPHDRRRESGP